MGELGELVHGCLASSQEQGKHVAVGGGNPLKACGRQLPGEPLVGKLVDTSDKIDGGVRHAIQYN